MKKLLNEAAHELVMQGYKSIKEMKQEMKTLETKGQKLNLIYETRERILKTYDKLNILKDKAKEQFPEQYPEDILGIDVDNHIFLTNVYLEDMLNVIHEVYEGNNDEI